LRKGFGATFLADIVVGDFLRLRQVPTEALHPETESSGAEDDLSPEVNLKKKLIERGDKQNGDVKGKNEDETNSEAMPPSSEYPYFVKPSTSGGKSDIVMFNVRTTAPSLKDGVYAAIQMTGVGRLRPNTLVIGWKNDWSKNKSQTKDYVDILRAAYANLFGVMICRNLDQFDFNTKRPNPFGTVDIWWLLDDGGLSVLIPYIMAKSQYWKGQTKGSDTVPIRLFIISDSGQEGDDWKRVSELMRRFRLDDIEVIAVSTDGVGASAQSVEHYHETIAPGLKKNTKTRPETTDRWIRVSELLRENSSEARLVFCTVPFPRTVSAHEYMSWLEMLSEEMPPMILIRGNGETVLTWYSE